MTVLVSHDQNWLHSRATSQCYNNRSAAQLPPRIKFLCRPKIRLFWKNIPLFRSNIAVYWSEIPLCWSEIVLFRSGIVLCLSGIVRWWFSMPLFLRKIVLCWFSTELFRCNIVVIWTEIREKKHVTFLSLPKDLLF